MAAESSTELPGSLHEPGSLPASWSGTIHIQLEHAQVHVARMVLAPGNGKTKTGRLWKYVRDDRPAGERAAPAMWFAYSPDRKGEHPERHLREFRGTLQADAYAGFNQLSTNDGRISRDLKPRGFRTAPLWRSAPDNNHLVHCAPKD